MKKKKKQKARNLNPILFSILVLLASFYIVKESNFNQPVPDVTELPKDVIESVKNVKPQKSFKVPILLYHYVEYVKDEKDTIRKSLNIIPYIFDQELKTLKDAGFNFITTKDLADALDDKATLSPKSVILTFDDGYRDFYTDVFPILKKYQVKAVVYVVPNFLDKPNNLTNWQLKELAESGLVEIGAHTMNHSYLTKISLDQAKFEIEESKRLLEKKLGIPIVSFAYPYGAFNNETIDIVKAAGFRSAVTTISGIFSLDVNRFFLYRIRPGGRVGQSLLGLLENTKLSKSEQALTVKP